MFFTFQLQRTKLLLFSLLIVLFIPAGCSIFPSSSDQTQSPANITLIVGGKLDNEAQLLTKMYVLLLRHAGFNVIERAHLGGNAVVFKAITSGSIDLYPEFTTTGLIKLNLTATGNQVQDYQTVKQGYEKNYHITWLNMSPLLNDTYGICTTKSIASQLHLTNITGLAQYASQSTIATPVDGKNDPGALPAVQKQYNITFGQEPVFKEEDTFPAVIDGQARFNVCYTTSSLISQYNFLLLGDDMHAFPAYYPAPIVRDDTLKKAPQIATILNQLSPRLTSEISSMLQGQVLAGFSIEDVARNWLKSQGLL